MEKETINDLITLRCLSLLFYNFVSDDIDELRKVQEFNHCWDELLHKAKIKKWGSIPDMEFYSLFSNVSYETQAVIIEHAKKKYGEEARRGAYYAVDF